MLVSVGCFAPTSAMKAGSAMRFLWIASALAIVGGLAGGGSPFAQQAETPTIQFAAMEYKPLTLWKKIAIGGAYYTDPSYVGRLRYAYGYDLNDIPQSAKDQLVELLKRGDVSAALISPTTGNASPISAQAVPQIEMLAKKQPVVILTASDTIFGQVSSTDWVADTKAPKN